MKSIKTKQKLYIASQSRNPVSVYLYKSYSNKLNHILEVAKKNYLINEISHLSKNSKLIWKNINDVLTFKNNHKTSSIECIKRDDSIVYNPVEIGNTINKFFASVGHNLNKTCINLKLECNFNYQHKSCFFKPITTSEIEKHINNLDVKKKQRT